MPPKELPWRVGRFHFYLRVRTRFLLVLDPDSTVPALSDGTRTLAVAGAPAQWAFPAADTLAGARYAAHRFLRRIKACRTR